MTDRAKQHFVPQFYFELFTSGDRRIQVLLMQSGRIILNASIKGQCARHKFYGSAEVEGMSSKLEARHSAALKRMLELAWSPSPGPLEPQHLSWLWEAVVFQRARTELQVEKRSGAQEAMLLDMFTQHLKFAPDIEDRDQILEHIEKGHIRVKESPQRMVSLSIISALESVLLISDLDFHILRNHTDYPFVFSDSPVVFHNTYYQNVMHRGVLGMQTPGLQIFYPLNSDTMLLLLDGEVYSGQNLRSLVIDISQRSDVSQLNALQLHHSLNAVYFANPRSEEYVAHIWHAHRPSVISPRDRLEKRADSLVDEKPVDGVVYQIFEPQLNIKLDLSFVECTPIDASEYRFRRRSSNLVEEHKKRCRHIEDA